MKKQQQKNSKQKRKQAKQKQKQSEKHKQKQPQPNKKKKDPQSQESSSSENADINLNQIEQNEESNNEISFLIAQINEKYYHSLKTILLRFGQISKVTNSQLADGIVQNKKIGNVSLADDESQDQDEQQNEEEEEEENDQQNVYSVLTILPGKIKLAESIKKTALKAAEKKGIDEKVKQLINNNSTSILINERITNLPAFIVNSSHEVFKKDMLELKHKQRALYNQLCSGYLLNISQVQFQGNQSLSELIYSKFEDYQMCKRCQSWWLGTPNQTFKKKADMRTLYYLIRADQYFIGVDNIKTYLEQ